MRHPSLRGAVLTLLLIGPAATASAEPIQFYFQGTVGSFLGSTPPPGISPTELYWGSFFLDPLATDLAPGTNGHFSVAGPFSLSIGSYTATASQTEVFQDPLTPTVMDLFVTASNMITDSPGAASARGVLEFVASGNANIPNVDPTSWVFLPGGFDFFDANGGLVWRFGGSLNSVDVPEPMTLALVLSGVAVAGARKLRRKS
jgi:hypothetical protein